MNNIYTKESNNEKLLENNTAQNSLYSNSCKSCSKLYKYKNYTSIITNFYIILVVSTLIVSFLFCNNISNNDNIKLCTFLNIMRQVILKQTNDTNVDFNNFIYKILLEKN